MKIKNVFRKIILFGKSMVSKPKLFSSSFDTSGTVPQEHLAENREVRSKILKSQSLPKDILSFNGFVFRQRDGKAFGIVR